MQRRVFITPLFIHPEATSAQVKKPAFHPSHLIDDHLSPRGESVEEGDTGIAGDADTAVGGGSAIHIPYMQADAAISEAHKIGHGAVVEIGTVVHVFLRDAENACGGEVGGRAGAHGEIHGHLLIYQAEPPLVGEIDHYALFTGAAQQGIIFPRAEGEPVVMAIAELRVISRGRALRERAHPIARHMRVAGDDLLRWRRQLGLRGSVDTGLIALLAAEQCAERQQGG